MKTIFSTRRLLLLTLALAVLVASSVGGTVAWFTDTVNTASNIIKSGKLDVEMYYADGTEAVPTADSGWTNAEQAAIFNNNKWEPGYTEVRHIKIKNAGNLAFNYKLNILTSPDEPSELAEVIDVYYISSAQQLTNRTMLKDEYKIGTLRELIVNHKSIANGALLPAGTAADDNPDNIPVGDFTATIALKMQESAGNEYQEKSLADSITLQLYASQYTFESDSIGNQYDVNASLPQVFTAQELAEAVSEGRSVALGKDITIDNDSVLRAKDFENDEYTLDLAGHNLTVDPGSTDGGIGVIGKIFNLINTVPSKESKFEHAFFSLMHDRTNHKRATLNIGTGVTLEADSKQEDSFGSIYGAAYADINLNGGKIIASNGSTAIYLSDGCTFNMNSGEILVNAGSIGCDADNVVGATINLTGGKMCINGANAYGLDLRNDPLTTVNLSSPFTFETGSSGFAMVQTSSTTYDKVYDPDGILDESLIHKS